MSDIQANNEIESFKNIKHKILFFFMPESILFEKPTSKDDPDFVVLKSISPLFYWCSAHEFIDFDKDYKYLIQYQSYAIENQNIVPGELIQKWAKTKYEIKDLMMSFLNMWPEHKRVLLNNKNENANGENQNIHYFSTFASFVAQSIFNFKNFYIQQVNSSGQNFDILQKEFWKMMALNSYNNIFYNQNKSKSTPIKKKKNSHKKKKTVNKVKEA